MSLAQLMNNNGNTVFFANNIASSVNITNGTIDVEETNPVVLTADNVLNNRIITLDNADNDFNVQLPEPLAILTAMNANNIYDKRYLNHVFLEFYLLNASDKTATIVNSALNDAKGAEEMANAITFGATAIIKLVLTRVGTAGPPAVAPQLAAFIF